MLDRPTPRMEACQLGNSNRATPQPAHRTGRRSAILLSALLFGAVASLPACVLAVGNSASGAAGLPKSTVPLLRQRVDAAQRVVTLRRARLDSIRLLHESGRAPTEDVAEAEIAVEEARIQLLQFEAELQAVQERDDSDDIDFD